MTEKDLQFLSNYLRIKEADGAISQVHVNDILDMCRINCIDEEPKNQMKIWIARNEGYDTDEQSPTGKYYVTRHIKGELIAFYDSPNLIHDVKTNRWVWGEARRFGMCNEIYMFGDLINDKECAEFVFNRKL